MKIYDAASIGGRMLIKFNVVIKEESLNVAVRNCRSSAQVIHKLHAFYFRAPLLL